MRIAYVITRADAVGGASIHVRDLARAFQERGDEVTVLLGGDGPVTEQLAAADVPYRSLRFLGRQIHPTNDVRAIVEMAAALGELRPDLVSTHTAKAGWIGRAAARRLGIPSLYTPHGWSIGDRISERWGGLFAIAERTAARWCAGIICVCEEERRMALARKIAPPEKLLVVHNGVLDVETRLRARPERAPVRICSVARFEAPKDHAGLFAALAQLRSEAWELDLVGDGPLLPEMQRQGSKLGLSERVRFHGYLSDPAAVLGNAQIFALSSRSEAFPRSILEALRAGLPVVASNVGGVGECVSQGVNGLLAPARDPAAFAAALGKLLSDPVVRQTMGREARATYESRFRVEHMVDRTARIYARLLK